MQQATSATTLSTPAPSAHASSSSTPPPPAAPGFAVVVRPPAICTSDRIAVYPVLLSSRTSQQSWVRLLRFSQVKVIRTACNIALAAAHQPLLPPLHSSLFSSRSNIQYLQLRTASIQSALQMAVDMCMTSGHPLHFAPEVLVAMGIDDLWRAASFGDVAHMQALITFSWDIDRLTPFGASPLHFACAYSQPEAVALLLKNQACVSLPDSFGHVPHQLQSLAELPVSYRLCHARVGAKVLVVFNPFSGTRKSPGIVSTVVQPLLSVLAEWGLTFKVIETQAAKHAVAIARESDADIIMCVSGDGIVHEVINGLFDAKSCAGAEMRGFHHTAIVHIPGGTGNGLSLSLGCVSPLDALMNVFNGRCTPHDIAVIQQPSLPPYLSFLSVAWGLVSDVDLESERFRYLGDLRLDVAAVSSIISRKTYKCTIQYLPAPAAADHPDSRHAPHVCGGGEWQEISGQQWYSFSDDVQLFLAANCNWVAKDFNAAPHFAFGDASFDLVILREHNSCASRVKSAANRSAMISFFLKLGNEGWIDSDLAARHVEYVKVTAFRLIPQATTDTQGRARVTQFDVDGERVESQSEVSATILPCAMTIAGMAAAGPVDAHVAVYKQRIKQSAMPS